jgi:hypothetical protein
MAGRIPATSGRIFICYRREETGSAVGWMYERLAERSGSEVSRGVGSIAPGDDFAEVSLPTVPWDDD